jgi:hypothetical protein
MSTEEDIKKAEEAAVETFKIKKLIKHLEKAKGYVVQLLWHQYYVCADCMWPTYAVRECDCPRSFPFSSESSILHSRSHRYPLCMALADALLRLQKWYLYDFPYPSAQITDPNDRKDVSGRIRHGFQHQITR